MGFVQSLFGSNTGAGYTANGVNSAGLSNAQGQVANTQQSQNDLLAALQGQNGVGNQSQVYNQLQGVANGTGPNPAQAQLAQATGANVAQTGALMAGQRGAAGNVGLMARQAGQTGAGIQQQAVGQAATLQANQSLNALNAAGNIANNQVGQQLSASQQAANTALGNQSNMYGLQGNINTTEAGIASGNQKAQAGLIGGVLGSVGAGSSTASSARGGMVGYADGGPVEINTPNSYDKNKPQSYLGQYFSNKNQPQTGGGGMNQDTGTSGAVAGQALGNLAFKGAKSAYNSLTAPNSSTLAAPDQSTWGNLSGTQTAGGAADATDAGAAAAGSDAAAAGAADAGGADAADLLLAADGGQVGYGADNTTVGGTLQEVMDYLAKGGPVAKPAGVKALVSPGETYLNPKAVSEVVKGKDPIKAGEKIPGKPKFKGDDYRNDTVPKTLQSGGIVIPNEVLQSQNPHQEAYKFVNAVLAKKKRK